MYLAKKSITCIAAVPACFPKNSIVLRTAHRFPSGKLPLQRGQLHHPRPPEPQCLSLHTISSAGGSPFLRSKTDYPVPLRSCSIFYIADSSSFAVDIFDFPTLALRKDRGGAMGHHSLARRFGEPACGKLAGVVKPPFPPWPKSIATFLDDCGEIVSFVRICVGWCGFPACFHHNYWKLMRTVVLLETSSRRTAGLAKILSSRL